MSNRYSPLPAPSGQEYTYRELLDLSRALEEAREFLPLETLSVAPARPQEGMVALADGTNWNPGEGAGFYGYRNGAWRILDSAITVYTAASVTKNTGGTATGNVASTQVMLDGSVYKVVEATGTPGFDIEFAWSGIVNTPSELILRYWYTGISTHQVTVELYRYTGTPGWDALSLIKDNLTYQTFVFALPAMANYLSGGAAKVRLYHTTSGNASHDISVDYIAFTNISAGGSTVSGGGATNLSYTASTRVLASDTGTDATLPLVTSGDAGLAPASGGGTTNFLRADATWAAPTATVADGDKGDITISSGVWNIDAATVGITELSASATASASVFLRGDNKWSRIDTTEDLIVDLATKGLVLKDTQGTPHYWRVTISNTGALVTTDLGTTKP